MSLVSEMETEEIQRKEERAYTLKPVYHALSFELGRVLYEGWAGSTNHCLHKPGASKASQDRLKYTNHSNSIDFEGSTVRIMLNHSALERFSDINVDISLFPLESSGMLESAVTVPTLA